MLGQDLRRQTLLPLPLDGIASRSAKVEVRFHPSDLDGDTVSDLVRIAGEIIGIGDWRPKGNPCPRISTSQLDNEVEGIG